MKISVLIIGTMPPPVGGITIHLKRFFQINMKSEEFDIFIFDLRKQKIFHAESVLELSALPKIFLKSKIFHIHVSNSSKILLAIIAKIFNKKVIYTQHNSRIKDSATFRFFIKLCNKVILVNDKNINFDSSGIKKQKFDTIPAFIEPVNFEKLPPVVQEKINDFDFIIAANCYKNVMLDGKQLYGFDTLIEAFIRLDEESKINNSLLVLVDPSNTMKNIIEAYNFTDSNDNNNEIYFWGDYLDFSSLIQKSNLVVRPTRTDGDALTVREALHFNIPVIRPDGSILFETGNYVDLSKKIYDVYSQKNMPVNYLNENFNEQILNKYRELIKN